MEKKDELPAEWSYKIMKAFFDHHGVVSQNVESFNKFLTTDIQDIITKEPIVVETYAAESFPVRHEIHFQRINIDRPKRGEGDGHTKSNLYPNDCLIRSMTYGSELFGLGSIRRFELKNQVWVPVALSDSELKDQKEVKVARRTTTKRKMRDDVSPVYEKSFFVYLGKVPVMVKSIVCHLNGLKETTGQARRECPLDPGGYFIINGKERVLVAQEKLPENKAVVYRVMKHSNFECECEVRSSIQNSLRPVNAMWIRLMKERKWKKLPALVSQKKNKLPPSKSASVDSESDDDDDDKEEDHEDIQEGHINIDHGKQLVVIIPRLQKPIPVVLLFKALGCSGPEKIKSFVIQGEDEGLKKDQINQLIYSSLSLWDPNLTRDSALEKIGSLFGGELAELTAPECRSRGREVLNDYVLQHVGTDPSADDEKWKHVCEMIRRICEVYLGWRKYDDRDHLINKRFELTGNLFQQLFKKLWRQVTFAVQKGVRKRLEGKDGSINYDLKNIIHPSTISQGLSYSVSTGNWTDRRGPVSSTGVSQELNKCCYVSALSHLRRVTTPSKLHRNIAARQLHSSNWGMICTNETPEGEPVGLVQNFALSAAISVGFDSSTIIDIINSHGLLPLAQCSEEDLSSGSKVVVNGRWIGMHEDMEELVRSLRILRRAGQIPSEVSISLDMMKNRPRVEIRCDAGRIYRPLMVVEGRKLKVTEGMVARLDQEHDAWLTLMREGVVEELDTAELINCHVAIGASALQDDDSSKIFSHCEIHPSMILGLSASTVPFANHNQAPRNTYQSGMAKQAVGLPATNFQHRSDPLAHVMHYPHRPIMSTFGADLCNIWELPAGVECIVAILCYQGYNQEDSLIFNQSSIDRGLLRSSVMHTYTDVENQVSARREQDECFERPEKGRVRFLKSENYSHLDLDGLPPVGSRIKERDPVIGKTVDVVGTKRDGSMTAKLNTNGVVFKALATTNEDGQRMHKVIVQETRIPKIGDKFASRHGQKGVIGLTLSQENMPFTKDGLVPDVILNPHAIPSRMTIGHLIEALATKSVCLSPHARKDIDASAFSKPLTADSFGQYLHSKGFHKHGEEIMYDGLTGEKLRATIFMGINYYQRLRHMIDDKLNMRNRGAVTLLEGQPKRGLTRDGAQRFGEMERDCTISHGAAGFIWERLFTVSDAANFYVCNNCGTLTSLNPFIGVDKDDRNRKKEREKVRDAAFFRCTTCADHGDKLSTIALPKAAKLLYQELMSMNIRLRFKCTDDFLTSKLVEKD